MKRVDMLLKSAGLPAGRADHEVARQMITYGSPGYHRLVIRSMILDTWQISADERFRLQIRGCHRHYVAGKRAAQELAA